MNAWILFSRIMYVDSNQSLVILTSISAFIATIQIFYWMALFEVTSFYVTMLTESLSDIKYFLLMVFVCIASFAHAIMVLDINKSAQYEQEEDLGLDVEEYAEIEDNKLENPYLNSIMA